MTHCLVGLPSGGTEEGGARGKAGTGAGAKGNRGAGVVGLRVDDGPKRDMVLWSWEVGAAAGVGMSG